MSTISDGTPPTGGALSANTYGLASGVVVDDRRPAPCRPCPECDRPLTGGPAVLWCSQGHTIHGGALEDAEERRRQELV